MSKLSFVHKFLGIGLVVLGLLLFLQPNAYYKAFQYGVEGTGFSFVEAGVYTIDICYKELAPSNTLIIYTDDRIDENNQPGVKFYEADIVDGEVTTRVQLNLDKDVHSLRFRTALDSAEKIYIDRVVIQGAQLQNRDHYLLGLMCVLGGVFVVLLGRYIPADKYKEQAMLVAFGLLASVPLFSDFVLNGDDLGFHVARLEAIYQGLRAGEFPVYLGSNKMGGYGMLSGTMYPSLFLYPVALLRFFKVSLMLCYKLLIVGMNVATAFAAYYSTKKMCNSSAIGFWASVFYTFSIYRLTNIYTRAALGEALAMIFLPLVIWGTYEILWGNFKKWYILALGMGGLLQCHVLSAEMCVLFLVLEPLVWLISRKRENFIQRILAGIKAIGLTIGVNAFFLYPFLYFFGENLQCFDMPNQIGETVVYFSQMFALYPPAEGMDVVPGSTTGEMAHTVGTVLLLGAGALCVEVTRNQEAKKEYDIGKRCLLYGAVALILSSWLFPWEKVQSVEWLYTIVTSIQFAWRFFSPASALLSVASAIGVVNFAKREKGKWICAVCMVLVICSTSYYFDMKGHQATAYNDKMSFNGFGHTDAMYMYSDGESFKPLNLQYDFANAYIRTLHGADVTYSDLQRTGMQMSVTIDAPENIEDYILFPLYYYPGYQLRINDEEAEILCVDSLVACKMPGGRSEFSVSYEGVPGASVANWVSLLSVTGSLIYLIFLYHKRRKKL